MRQCCDHPLLLKSKTQDTMAIIELENLLTKFCGNEFANQVLEDLQNNENRECPVI